MEERATLKKLSRSQLIRRGEATRQAQAGQKSWLAGVISGEVESTREEMEAEVI